MDDIIGRIYGQVRSLASVGGSIPAALGGLGVGLLTLDRRRGVNFFLATWPRLMLAASGVELNVLGEENLHKQRPAVFIFNHRNNFDPFITAALIGGEWTGVGKKELANNPLMGALGKMLDTVYIDRDDTASAVESLKRAEELAAKGLSVLMAPEGSRSDADGVADFKKGPFRIAMAAGIPVVPVVIRNAGDIAARDSTAMEPGTVDVAVFPPISVRSWTGDTLPLRIAAVRQLYLDTLSDWPAGRLRPPKGLYRNTTKRSGST